MREETGARASQEATLLLGHTRQALAGIKYIEIEPIISMNNADSRTNNIVDIYSSDDSIDIGALDNRIDNCAKSLVHYIFNVLFDVFILPLEKARHDGNNCI